MVDKLWYVVVENVDKANRQPLEFLPLAGPYYAREIAETMADEIIGRFKMAYDRFWFAKSGVAGTTKEVLRVVYPEYTEVNDA